MTPRPTDDPADDIAWDVVPPPPTTAFDRVQTRTAAVARASRRRLPESRRTRWLVLGIVLVAAIAAATTWWLRRPPPGSDHDLLVRFTTSAEAFRPAEATADAEAAEAYVDAVFGWSIQVPEMDALRLTGAGEAMLAPRLSVPAFRYETPDGDAVVVFAYDYVFLGEVEGTLDLPEATYALLAEPEPVDTRRLGQAYLVTWRHRAVIYTAVMESDAAFEQIGQAVRSGRVTGAAPSGAADAGAPADSLARPDSLAP